MIYQGKALEERVEKSPLWLKLAAAIATGYLIGYLLTGEAHQAPRVNNREIQPYATGLLAPY